MRMTTRGPIRPTGWAFPFLLCNWDGNVRAGRFLRYLVGCTVLLVLLLLSVPLMAQQDEDAQAPAHEAATTGHEHHGAVGDPVGWEGSPQAIAYSEFNHHLTGLLVLVIGLSELRQALAMPFWAWTRFLLPGALLAAAFFLLVWSDHEAWPIGSLSFSQTFFGSDPEIIQHKSFALLSLTVGTIELLRRLGQFGHAVWATPLPVYAIIGGLALFGHSHGAHPSAHTIALHHALMGTLAITAGSSKLVSKWQAREMAQERSYWDVAWAGLILLIAAQLLIYSE